MFGRQINTLFVRVNESGSHTWHSSFIGIDWMLRSVQRALFITHSALQDYVNAVWSLPTSRVEKFDSFLLLLLFSFSAVFSLTDGEVIKMRCGGAGRRWGGGLRRQNKRVTFHSLSSDQCSKHRFPKRLTTPGFIFLSHAERCQPFQGDPRAKQQTQEFPYYLLKENLLNPTKTTEGYVSVPWLLK